MTKHNDGGQAFPTPGLSNLPNDQFVYPENGMTLRDYFAGQLLAGADVLFSDIGEPENAAIYARKAYTMADAMIAERAK